MANKSRVQLRVCRRCGRERPCDGWVCNTCRKSTRCQVCGGPKDRRKRRCEGCDRALSAAVGANYGGDLRPADVREVVIRRYCERAAAGLPLFGGDDGP